MVLMGCMNKSHFASYKFKPSDVIDGLNRYFAESKAYRYRRVPLEIKNGEVKPGNYYVIRNIVFDVSTPKIKECGYYYLICDPEEVVGVAINWLREEHNIFYTPGMNEPPIKDPDDIFCMENLKETKNFSITIDDFCVDDAAKEYEKATRKDMVSVAKVREALGIAEDSDIFQCIKYRNSQLEILRTEVAVARRRYNRANNDRSYLGKRLVDIRKAAGMADDDPTDLVKYVEQLREKAAEQQKKIDSYESTLSKITDIMEPKYAGPAWSETWDDLVERIKRMKTKHDDVRGLSLKIEELEEQLREKAWENSVLRDNVDYFADLAQGRQTALSNLHDEIDKVYCEIFDCSNGGPEGTYKETLQDILTEYKRVLELKNVAEEKTIKYKELARENEDTAKENKVQWNNTKEQLQWAQKENLEWLKRYEALKSELNEMKTLYCAEAVGNGGLCEDLTKEREKVERLKEELSTSNGAMDVLRNLHDSIVGLPYDFDDSPQILGVRIIDKFNHNRTNGCRYLKRMRELEHKLEDIKDICDGNSDVMNIIG